MGLDISVMKPVNPEGKDLDALKMYVFTLKDTPELEVFKDLVFEKENEYYDTERALTEAGYDPKNVDCTGTEFGEDTIFNFETKDGGVRFEIKNPPTLKVIERCVACEEVGYQRKGANKQFYEDDMWNSPCVMDAKTLNEHWEKYFSFETPNSPGDGFGSSVEYSMDDTERKTRFKENIIDNFVEGETFVVYH